MSTKCERCEFLKLDLFDFMQAGMLLDYSGWPQCVRGVASDMPSGEFRKLDLFDLMLSGMFLDCGG